MVSRRLPTVGPARPGAEPARGGGKDAVDAERAAVHVSEGNPERIRDGWEHRFVAAGARAEEMIALYRELGFEVVADPVPTEALIDGCTACFGTGGQEYRSIYTRREHTRQPDRTGRPDHAGSTTLPGGASKRRRGAST